MREDPGAAVALPSITLEEPAEAEQEEGSVTAADSQPLSTTCTSLACGGCGPAAKEGSRQEVDEGGGDEEEEAVEPAEVEFWRLPPPTAATPESPDEASDSCSSCRKFSNSCQT